MKFLLFLLVSSNFFAHGISESDKLSMINGGYLQYIQLGASHMITGYDHLLFLFGVIFFLNKFKDIVKFITIFTLGHSITLIFATFMSITANYFLVDAVIALTVVYKGFDNLDGFKKHLNMKAPNLLSLVFIFGLIHGFGLSTRLQQLPLGTDGLLLKIISFNIGVELGQVSALFLMLILLNNWRKYDSFKKFSDFSNSILMIIGSLLFLMQINGYLMEDKSLRSKASLQALDTNKSITWKDTITLTIDSQKSFEYKFHIQKNNTFEYTWQTNQEKLFFDFHGEPDNDKTAYFESFKKGTNSKSSGVLNSAFTGSHGWYFKNTSTRTIQITLKTRGSYKVLGIK
ncbi:MAG: hypothetical protein COB02_08215 [Candidatus Cloacimonadota bacterium]|nr:MAG: hypothetical protein COB02_08215 [Candidatus Cloacimonadota bacterium]